jgi:catechol 2,3-dioxygenase
MALKGVLRPGFAQLRVLDLQAAVRHYVDHLGLHMVGAGPDGRVYLKGRDEFDRHSVVLREAEQAGIDLFSFKVDSEESLDRFAGRLREYGLAVTDVAAGEQVGVGRRVCFTLPSGHRIDLYHKIARSEDAPEIDNPYIWKSVPHGMGAIRMDHILLYGPDIDKNLEIFTRCLDFSLAEKVDGPDGAVFAIWLSCSNKAHDIAFVKHSEPGKLHHVAFFIEDWNAIGHAADIMVREDIAIDLGPTRHGITRGQTIYFFDPSGNRNEVFAGGYTYYPDDPVRTWSFDQVGRGIFYYERALNDRFLAVLT